jgi:hypothetical protein
MYGKCPHCGGIVMTVNLTEVTVSATGQKWVGVSYQCPLCNAILSVGIDPVALKTDLRNEILAALGRG